MNNPPVIAARNWLLEVGNAWNQFWFSAQKPHALAVLRIGCGAMLAYVHTVWLLRQSDFLGPNAWIDAETSQLLHQNDWAWSYLWYTENLWLTGLHEALALVASLMMMLGLLSRLSIPLAWFLTLMTCHRLTLALFGLDQIVVMLSMYLMLSNSGSVWSVDARWKASAEGTWLFPAASGALNNNIATRFIQLHLCVIYLFGGLSKLRGEMWFDGSALWFAIVNFEYQSVDLTWLGRSPLLIAVLTAATIFWETFYCALVWPRLTRPIALGMAIFVHAGIALGLGMITFGAIMILANMAFVDPTFFERYLPRSAGAEPLASA